MTNTKKKINIKRCILVAAILIFIIALLITNKDSEITNELTILMNNELISLKDEVIIDEEKNIFFSKDDVQAIFDNTIYYNEIEEELITTYNEHVALLKVGEKYTEINDETIELKGMLQKIKDDVYIPMTDLEIVYDIEIAYSESNNRIIIDSVLKEKKQAAVIQRTNLKKKKGVFSSKLDKLIIGENVVILEDLGNYKKVRSPRGNIGFIKSNKLSNEVTIREKVENKKIDLQVYKNYSNISGIYDDIQVDESKLNVVIPTFFYLDKNSKVLDKSNSSTATYSIYEEWARKNSLQILPVFTNNESVSDNLLSYSERSKVINSLMALLIDHNYIGINIEINTIDYLNSFNRFILELVPRFKEANLKVAVTLNNNLEKDKLEKVVDYIIEK